MIEILFKAKRKNWRDLPKEEWWVEGYQVKYQPCASKDEYVYGIVPTYASALYIIEIDRTLCQFTGMIDKNGKRIWENDIVKHEISGIIGTVKWYEEDYVGWCVDDAQIGEQQFDNEMWDKCEVVGNRFDNVELLEWDGGAE